MRGWVRLRVLLVAAGVALTLGAGHAAALPATQEAHPAVVASRDRGLWVWDQADPVAVVAFALTHRVGRLFLAIPVDVTSTSELLRVQQTIVAAHAVGIKVDALGGDPGWVDNPDWVLTHWLTPALLVAGFDGVHVDVEPYGNPSWVTDQRGTTTRYLQLLAALAAGSAQGGRPFEADVPFWFNTVADGAGGQLDTAVLARVSSVAIMAYRNTATGPDGSLALAGPTLTAARAVGKQAHIGQETRYLGASPFEVKQTFFGQTNTQLETQLGVIDSAERTDPAYLGVAVHDRSGWSAISPGPPMSTALTAQLLMLINRAVSNAAPSRTIPAWGTPDR